MIHTVFTENKWDIVAASDTTDWIIYAHDYTFNLKYSYYSQHK
ncbi:hypothetical protein LCGC14_2666980, partial [marine sediment metagenome]